MTGAPPGAALDPEGLQLWVSDPMGHHVLAFDAQTGASLGERISMHHLPEPRAAGGFEPSATQVVGDEVWVTNYVSGEVLAFGAHDSSFRGVVHDNGSAWLRLEEPAALRLVDELVLVLGNDTRNVGVFDTTGEALGELGGASPIRNPHGLEMLPDGRVLVATSPSVRDLGLVQVWDLELGERVGHFGPWPELEEGTDVVLDPRGRAVVTDWWQGRLLRYDPDSGELLDVWVDEGLDGPISVRFAPSGRAFVLDSVGVHRIDADGTVHRVVDGEGVFTWARTLEIVVP